MYSSIQTGGKEGMQTLDQCLKEMVKKGMTTVEEARMKSADPRSFSINCRGTNRQEHGPRTSRQTRAAAADDDEEDRGIGPFYFHRVSTGDQARWDADAGDGQTAAGGSLGAEYQRV